MRLDDYTFIYHRMFFKLRMHITFDTKTTMTRTKRCYRVYIYVHVERMTSLNF